MMLKAKGMIKEAGQEFDPKKHEIKLLYRGKMMGED